MIRYNSLDISTIRSGKGDCIHIRFHDEGNQYLNIIIDTGPTATSGAFRSLVNEIMLKGEVIDCLIITHYDDDHIGGALRCDNLPIKSAYFNAYNAEEDNGLLSARQAQRLLHLLSTTVVHNHIIAGTDIDVGSARIHVIAPSRNDLNVIIAPMKKADKDYYTPLSAVSDWKYSLDELADRAYPKPDISKSNRSSIVFVLHYENHKFLFCGDAPADCITSQLHYNHFDLIKLPHHGSIRNISDELLDHIDCNSFLVCADGTAHPNKQTIAKLLRHYGNITVYSNYSWWKNDFLTDDDINYIQNGELQFREV